MKRMAEESLKWVKKLIKSDEEWAKWIKGLSKTFVVVVLAIIIIKPLSDKQKLREEYAQKNRSMIEFTCDVCETPYAIHFSR